MDTLPTPAPSGDRSRNFLAISIITAALIIGGAVLYSNGGSRPGYTAQVAGPAVAPVPATADDDVVLGSASAPVTLIIFGDYQCPFCKRMYDDAEAKLRQEYVATGKLKVVYRDFPLDGLHPFARPVAEAAECARDQEKYWGYHDYLFEHQAEIPSMDFAAVAATLGLDRKQFAGCVASRKYKDEVEKDYQDGIAAGVTGTPGSFVDGTFISGAQPYEVFKAAVEAALAS